MHARIQARQPQISDLRISDEADSLGLWTISYRLGAREYERVAPSRAAAECLAADLRRPFQQHACIAVGQAIRVWAQSPEEAARVAMNRVNRGRVFFANETPHQTVTVDGVDYEPGVYARRGQRQY
jgi:hypothetical protein